jgi:hypothetical protein
MNKNFLIEESEANNFASICGDYNDIHFKNDISLDSILEEKIVHGVLVITKFLNYLKSKELNNLNINFHKYFLYNKNIYVKRNKNNYILKQNNETKVTISFLKKIIELNKKKKINKIYKSNINIKKFKNKIFNKNLNLFISLCKLSYYAGMIFPGKKSLINSINIYKNKKNIKNLYIQSWVISNKYKIYGNLLKYKNLEIFFETSKLPTLKKKKIYINKSLVKKIKKINKNILIIGSSSGMGQELINLFKINKKIKIFGTYNMNKVKIYNKNFINLKINLEQNKNIIEAIIKNYSPLLVYYFASPKINLYKKNLKTAKQYRKFFIKIPFDIAKKTINLGGNFFYPSTILIKEKNNSLYTKCKFRAENLLNKLSRKIKIYRFPYMNTKQNLNLFRNNFSSFTEIFVKDIKLQKKILSN